MLGQFQQQLQHQHQQQQHLMMQQQQEQQQALRQILLQLSAEQRDEIAALPPHQKQVGKWLQALGVTALSNVVAKQLSCCAPWSAGAAVIVPNAVLWPSPADHRRPRNVLCDRRRCRRFWHSISMDSCSSSRLFSRRRRCRRHPRYSSMAALWRCLQRSSGSTIMVCCNIQQDSSKAISNRRYRQWPVSQVQGGHQSVSQPQMACCSL